MADSHRDADPNGAPRADRREVTLRQYLTESLAACEAAAAQKQREADQILGQATAYRALLVQLGPESVAPVEPATA